MKKLLLSTAFLGGFFINKAQTWVSVASSVTNEIMNIQFVNSTVGYAVGTSSTIITTTNGGVNWTPKTYTNTNHIWDLYFTSPTNGWILAGGFGTNDLYSIINSGNTWTGPIINDGMTGQLKDMHFTSPTNGWVIGTGGQIYATTNGTTWVAQTSGTSAYLTRVFFINNTTGWISVYNGNVLRTTDGGNTWASVSTGTIPLSSVNFISPTQGWAVGGQGTITAIYTTTNGGLNWTAQNSNIGTTLLDVRFISAIQGWAVGENGKIITTTDGGTTWTQQTTGTTQYFNSLATDFNNQLWAVGNTGIMYKIGTPNVTGINEVDKEMAIRIFPNPTNDVINLEFDSEKERTIQVVNGIGKVIKNLKTNSKNITVDIEDLQSGIYYTTISSPNEKTSCKIIKQ